MQRKSAGLTLIEMLVILLIIMTLVLVALPPLYNAGVRAQIARAQQDMQTVESALEWYYLDHKKYPESSGADLMYSAAGKNGRGLARLVALKYLEIVPEDRFKDVTVPIDGPLVYQFGSSGVKTTTTDGKRHRVPAWILVSPGPDKVTDSQKIQQFPFGTVAWQYDPVNGLHSEGDIIRLGGDWQLGDWYLDGHSVKGPESN